jgi:hypothetical protein
MRRQLIDYAPDLRRRHEPLDRGLLLAGLVALGVVVVVAGILFCAFSAMTRAESSGPYSDSVWSRRVTSGPLSPMYSWELG